MSSAAQLDILPLDEAAAQTEAPDTFALKEQVAERLAAHRARRTRTTGPALTPIAAPSPAKARSARIAAAVAERYAQSQSYRAFLAAEAESAIRQAEAAAEVAALSARAVAEAQNQLLFELDQITDPANSSPVPAPVPALPPQTAAVQPSAEHGKTQASQDGLTVRFYEDVDRSPTQSFAQARPRRTAERLDEAEGLALDEEIAFRQAPVFEEHSSPIDIPANLIEFPRQLVAARKARPRLAEGPLREESDPTHDAAQLRIFEVEATQISTAPTVESAAPEWSSIMLGALPAAAPVETPEAPFPTVIPFQTASLELRLMAGVVDGCIITAALLAFTAVFAITAAKLPGGHTNIHMPVQIAAIGAAGTLAAFALLYQLLFFTLSDATPGMRYARIGLCTFSDDNPTRAAMRRRIFAVLLSACPLGLGFLWAWLDDDRLGWHDRISRMYQRSY
jgi:uncharacterized RDD family membrane protein YckC